jgi:hypothetical protein
MNGREMDRVERRPPRRENRLRVGLRRPQTGQHLTRCRCIGGLMRLAASMGIRGPEQSAPAVRSAWTGNIRCYNARGASIMQTIYCPGFRNAKSQPSSACKTSDVKSRK